MSNLLCQIISCPGCRVGLRIPARYTHLRVRCPRCDHRFELRANLPEPVSHGGHGAGEPEWPDMRRPARRGGGLWLVAIFAVLVTAVLLLDRPVSPPGPLPALPLHDASRPLPLDEASQTRVGIDPCAGPLTWRIGTIDPGFNLSREDLRQAVAGAAAVWEGPAGRQLFAYDPNGSVSINLVHDRRRDAARLGGAPSREATFLRVGSFRGRTTSQGNLLRGRIDVYRAGSTRQLTLVLAHELGHALGLQHVADRRAIMHATVHGFDLRRPVRARSADLTALGALCG